MRYRIGIPREEYLCKPFGKMLDLISTHYIAMGASPKKADNRPLDEIMIPYD